MWIKYRRGSLAAMVSESYRFGEDPVADVGMNRAAFDHVDLGPQQIPEIAQKLREVEDRATRFQVHQEIHIAIRPVLARRYRSEHTYISATAYLCQSDNLGPFFPSQGVQCHHNRPPPPFSSNRLSHSSARISASSQSSNTRILHGAADPILPLPLLPVSIKSASGRAQAEQGLQ